ncbi:NAD(P)/FAD-dependent oxidoreductase [Oceanirhabdus seepicola]|uniref:NAD(P)/FAD-dependent oxidoreductase n=1 Tax=Oceanirhabdus seepicola TaxID=2828781 RepID=A0A9J6NZ21_9CLOT|nr:NAD(P)/FAD-dependent oxidoreductase [Oceanirhabdus seepicola]
MPKYAVLQRIRNNKRTYAITPRIPGGFVNHKTLLKITEVAEKYNASIKLTSGQRLMIIGLKAEDVEKAWKDLGMEPAVLSPYSVKNVEMCPATFCKRMKQNSLPLGLRLEKRFYGAPTPNRTKIGVAGCRNACGSVNSKDIGVIGTKDEGYIVIAGGSAGYHPRLSDKIASNLNEDEAFNMVESIYEFYNDNAELGTKLGDFIDQITLDKFIQGVYKIYDEINPKTIEK